MFDKLIEVLVFGAGYERIGDETCSATTLRRRRDEWIELGVMEQLRLIALEAYDRMIGLDLHDLPLDGCITKAPSGGDCAGPSPVDRAKDGIKRSQVSDGYGIPLGTVAAPANRPDHTLLDATLDTLSQVRHYPMTPGCTWTPATTTVPPAKSSTRMDFGRRSHPRARRPPSSTAADG